jgi:hypothetical protein
MWNMQQEHEFVLEKVWSLFICLQFDDYRLKMKQLIKKEKWFGEYKEGPYKFINKEMKTFWNNDKGTCLNFSLF